MRICPCGGVVKEHSLIDRKIALTCKECGRYEAIDDVSLDMSATEDDVVAEGFLFFHYNKAFNRSHIYTGKDTACRMLSTGGLKLKEKSEISPTTGGREICMMCQNAFYRYKNYGKKL